MTAYLKCGVANIVGPRICFDGRNDIMSGIYNNIGVGLNIILVNGDFSDQHAIKNPTSQNRNCLMPSLRMTDTIRETFVSMGSTGAKSLETRDGWVFVEAGYMNGQMKHNVETSVYDGWQGVVEMGGCILRKSRERGI
uniref:ILEI/PANDER domain-containing protein n=1 Tax=Salmo trutta TaxID=8032 RepID=A0A673WW60_SALTR